MEQRELVFLSSLLEEMGLSVEQAEALEGGRWKLVLGPAGEARENPPGMASRNEPAPLAVNDDAEAEPEDGDRDTGELAMPPLDEVERADKKPPAADGFDGPPGLDAEQPAEMEGSSPGRVRDEDDEDVFRFEESADDGEDSGALDLPDLSGLDLPDLEAAGEAASVTPTGREVEEVAEVEGDGGGEDVFLDLPAVEFEEDEAVDGSAAEHAVEDQRFLPRDEHEPADLQALLQRSTDELKVTPGQRRKSSPFRQAAGAPDERARRLARTLVSDIISYSVDEHQSALEGGVEAIREAFADEIELAREQFLSQIDPTEVPDHEDVFRDAVNELLGNGHPVL